jgi:peptidyl-prolyl cis-trans isomerase D
MVSGRVVKYEAAHQLPLADVKTRVHDRLVTVQAAAIARKLGEARLAELRAAPDTALTEAAVTVSRAQPKELDGPLIDAVMKAPAAKLPAFVGVDLGDVGYAVVKIGKVLGRDPVAADAKGAQAQYGKAWADAEGQAYYAALKARFKVEIRPNVLMAVDSAASGASGNAK